MGRDDGHVWHEQHDAKGKPEHFIAGPTLTIPSGASSPDYGAPRQTPMLAGRVAATGREGAHLSKAGRSTISGS